MRLNASVATALLALAATLGLASTAGATATITYVSSVLGNDSNSSANCPELNPCRLLTTAHSVTTAGGEIFALDGGNFGPLTITKAITINGVEGSNINVPAGSIGITVTAAASDIVTVRNIQFSGNGSGGNIGVLVNSGRLILENSRFRRLQVGLAVGSSKADVLDSDFVGNTFGVVTSGQGSDFSCNPNSFGNTAVRIRGGNVLDNGTAFTMHDPGLGGPQNQCNRITVFLFTLNGAISVNIIGNTTLVTGDGASCTANAQFCQQVGSYFTPTNQQPQP